MGIDLGWTPLADSDGQVSLRWVSVDSEYSRARITSAKLPFVRPSGSIFVSFVCIGQLATVSVSVKVLSDRKLPVSGSEVADNRRKLPVSRSEKADNRRQLSVTDSEEADNRRKLSVTKVRGVWQPNEATAKQVRGGWHPEEAAG